ncbi:hypothetical protein Btru_050910 [Bulinus truncatus]|nr:hypothetical protein Btru_050910 [Bulinus truncatus]
MTLRKYAEQDEDDKSESVSETSTKDSDSVASGTLADSDHSAPVEIKANTIEKETSKRLKKLESRFHDFVARKELAIQTGKEVKPSFETGKNPTLPVKPTSVSPTRVDILFGRPDISEFQRFLYGVDRGEASGEQGVGDSVEKTTVPETLDQVKRDRLTQAHKLLYTDDGSSQLKSAVKGEDSPDTDIQSSIIKKLENLEKAIMKMSKCVPRSYHDLHSTEQPRTEDPCLNNASGKILDGNLYDAPPYRAGAQRMPGNVSRQEEAIDFTSTSCTHLTRSPCYRGYYDNGKTASDMAEQADSCRKSQHDLTNRFSNASSAMKPLHFYCPCQHTATQALDYSKKFQDTPPSVGKAHHVRKKSAGCDDNPCKKFQDLYGLPAAPEKCLSEQEREDMVHRIVQMVSAQLLPRLSGQLSGAQYPEMSQEELSVSKAVSGGVSGQQYKKHRCLSAPNVKWSEAQRNTGSSSLTHVCGGFLPPSYLLPKEEAVQVSIRQEDTAADGSSYSSMQKQPDPLASQQFFSAQNSQETVDTQSFYSMQQHLQDIRASLENIHNAQRLQSRAVSTGTLQPYRAVQTGLSTQLARPFNSTPLFTPNKTTEPNNSQLLRRSSQPFSGEFFSVETPLTIEIHDYQPLLPSTGISYSGKSVLAEKEKEQFRKHAKTQMHRLKAHQKQGLYSSSPKNENNVTGSGSMSYAYRYGNNDAANKFDEEVDLAVDDCKPEKRDPDSLERHVHFHYSHPYKFEAGAANATAEESSSSNTLVCEEKTDCVEGVRLSSEPIVPPGRGPDDVFQGKLDLHRSGSRLNEREDGEALGYKAYVDSQRMISHGQSHARETEDKMSYSKDVGVSKGDLSKDEDFASQDMYDITNNLSQMQDNEEIKKSRTKNAKTICISNLPLNLEEIRLLYLLKPHGHVTKIYFIKHRTTGAFQGIAYIKFSREEDARSAAKALHKTNVDGQTVFARIHSQGK